MGKKTKNLAALQANAEQSEAGKKLLQRKCHYVRQVAARENWQVDPNDLPTIENLETNPKARELFNKVYSEVSKSGLMRGQYEYEYLSVKEPKVFVTTTEGTRGKLLKVKKHCLLCNATNPKSGFMPVFDEWVIARRGSTEYIKELHVLLCTTCYWRYNEKTLAKATKYKICKDEAAINEYLKHNSNSGDWCNLLH